MRSTCLTLSRFWTSVAMLVLTSSVSGQAAETRFEYHDFREALKQAREHDLPMIVHFSTTWCGPCRTMNQMVFSSPQLKEALAGKIILVKVDGDQSPELVRMYRITQYPTDLFVDPDGRVLATSSGATGLNEYITQAIQVQARYQQTKKILASRNKSGHSPAKTSPLDVRLGQPAPFPRELFEPANLPAEQLAQSDLEERVPDPREIDEQTGQSEPEVVFIALDGYCPVKLYQERAWVRGNPKWTVQYRQQKYLFSDAESRDLFEADPQKYAPRLLGCDPVIMWETDRAIPGSTEFAAYYNDSLYLFSTAENREIFEIDPERYTNTRHVLAPRDVEATLIR